jgi:predicted nucleic acid-binding Zn ribbon protein
VQEHSEHDMAVIDQEDDIDQIEDEEFAEIIPTTTKRKRLNMLLFVALILVIIIFTYAGVTVIQHVPPSTSDDNLGAIYHAVSSTGIFI